MKKFLICILHVALAVGFVSCEKGIEGEGQFIGTGDGGIDDSGNPFWEWASVFPGPVNQGVAKPDTTVTVLGQYEPIPYSPETPILQSTGLYAGLDLPVTVEVPAGVSNLKWQIGLGQPLAAGQGARRYVDVTTKGSLSEGVNVIASSFGGYLYFYYEPQDVASAQESINVNVSGAYASFDYIKGSDGDAQRYYTNTIKDRVEKLKNTSISDDENVFLYWTELRSPKVILTFGLKEMEFLTGPELLLEQYEKLVDAYLDLGGFDKNVEYKLPPFRVYADIQLPNPAQKKTEEEKQDERRAPGYPIGVFKSKSMRGTDYKGDERRYMNYNETLDFGFKSKNKIGVAMVHNSFQMTTASDWASAVWIRWPYQRVANMFYCQQLDPSFWGSDPYTKDIAIYAKVLQDKQLTGDDPYMDTDKPRPWYKADFRNHPGGGSSGSAILNGDEAGNVYGTIAKTKEYEAGRTIVFMQLVQQYGWGILKYINRRAREVGFVNEYEQDAHDFFAMAACEYADADLRPFFRWHQFPYTAHVVKFIRDNGFENKPLPKTFVDGDRSYYFFDWPLAAETFFPNNIPDVWPDKWAWDPANKASQWPEKPYYKEIIQTGGQKWTPYLEIIETDYTRVGSKPYGQNDGTEYSPDFIPTPSQDNLETKQRMGFLGSNYINQRANESKTIGIAAYFDNNWINDGWIGRLKGGKGQGGGDYCPNYAIIDVDFGVPIKLNAIKTRQPKWDFGGEGTDGSPFANYILYFQYYVEPPYNAPSDPNDPSSPQIEVRSGSRNGVYMYAPDSDPNRVIWTGVNPHDEEEIPNPTNTVPYPGRTKNKKDGETINEVGDFGFRPEGYFAHVNTRFPIHEKWGVNQDWYTGITWIIRDGWNRTYVYYLEETIETRRVRFWVRPSLVRNRSGAGTFSGEKRGNNFGHQGTSGSWHIRLREIAFGLVDTEVPAPGQIPQPHITYKGMEEGWYSNDYDNVKYKDAQPRNYGGIDEVGY